MMERRAARAPPEGEDWENEDCESTRGSVHLTWHMKISVDFRFEL